MVNTPNFRPGVGRIATDLFDFNSHIQGQGFRHDATQIDIKNPSQAPGNATTVENALDFVASFIASQSGVGEGFITVGDGYDIFHANDGYFDPTIPSLDTLLNPIFQAMIAGSPLNPGLQRIQHGGVILIKAGTYLVKHTIAVPPSITLLGEGYGTKIINATNLIISQTPGVDIQVGSYAVQSLTNTVPSTVVVSPPMTNLTNSQIVNINNVNTTGGNPLQINGSWTVSGVITNSTTTTFTINNSALPGTFVPTDGIVNSGQSVFRLLTDNNRSTNDAAVDPTLFMFSRETKFFNMVIADNFVEPPFLGSTAYKLPQNVVAAPPLSPNPSKLYTQFAQPLITQNSGSNATFQNVLFLGRANFFGNNTVSQISSTAVGLDVSNGAFNGSLLKIDNCFIDGFQFATKWLSTGGSLDYLEVVNNKIRSYGVLQYGSGLHIMFAGVCSVNDGNTKVAGNTLYLDSFFPATTPDFARQALVLTNNHLASTPNLQARSRILITSNNINIDKSNNSTVPENTTNGLFILTALGGNLFPSYATGLAFGNVFQDDFQILVNSAIINLDDTGTFANLTANTATFNGAVAFHGNFTTDSATTSTFNGDIEVPNTMTLGIDSITTSKGVIKNNVKILDSSIGSSVYNMDATQNVNGYDQVLIVNSSFIGADGYINLVSAATNNGRVLIVKDNGFLATPGNSLTLRAMLGETIEGSSFYTLSGSLDSITIVSNATNLEWHVI